MRKALLILSTCCSLAIFSPQQIASAQSDNNGAASSLLVTKWNALPVSLEHLLDDGWQISSMGGTVGGFSYVLKHDQLWITCIVVQDPSQSWVMKSQCASMN
jgi:hypothetical protein